jgi:mannose-6-phosphate isomerase-like protein (cupin superfamily)
MSADAVRATVLALRIISTHRVEPGHTPEFDEYTVVLRGLLRVESRDGQLDVRAGQAVSVTAGEWIRYSAPTDEGAEYIAVCVPAFSPETVHRDPG